MTMEHGFARSLRMRTRVIADSDAVGAERNASAAARTARIAANATHHRLAVRRITDALDRTCGLLKHCVEPGKTRLLKHPGLFGRSAWGWRIEYPKLQAPLPFAGPPGTVGTAPPEATVPSGIRTAQT